MTAEDETGGFDPELLVLDVVDASAQQLDEVTRRLERLGILQLAEVHAEAATGVVEQGRLAGHRRSPPDAEGLKRQKSYGLVMLGAAAAADQRDPAAQPPPSQIFWETAVAQYPDLPQHYDSTGLSAVIGPTPT